MFTFHHRALDHIKPWFEQHRSIIIAATGTTAVLIFVFVAGNFAYGHAYQKRIYPGVTVGGVAVGGFNQAEATEVLQAAYRRMLEGGLWINLEGESARVDLQVSGADDPDLVYNLIDFDADRAVEIAMIQGREDGYFGNAFSTLRLAVAGKNVQPELTLAEEKILESIRAKFMVKETPGVATDYEIEGEGEKLTITVIPGTAGRVLDTTEVVSSITRDALDFKIEPQTISLHDRPVEVGTDQAESLIDRARSILNAAPYKLTYTGEDKIDHEWQIKSADLAVWLEPQVDEETGVRVGLNAEQLGTFFESIHEEIDIEPVDAKFVIEGNTVQEFQGSRDGVTLDDSETAADLTRELGHENVVIPVVVKLVEPTVPTNQVNNLGITEILGVGISNFSGSPSNRIKNIQHGAAKLNGLLVAPGETVSLLERLQPFTVEDGYLPELVIKGDEIKPEVGGGLCQIGTTTFRAVMNSGLEVVERRNHSLVVSYYNDPTNNKPGTDATIYDPAPDFKFQNNTANYILLTTEVDMDSKELHFTFWGTSDGREGWYDAPTLLGWTGAGEPVRKETTDLAPGQEKCQAAHPGASTTFDYHVKYADGTQVDKTFASVYRALPKICLVGVETLSEPATETPAAEASTETPTETEAEATTTP